MHDTERAAVVLRLKSIEGHIGGIIRMMEGEAYCIDVIRQVQAVQGALDGVAEKALQSHLNTCVVSAAQSDDAERRDQMLGEIGDVFKVGQRYRR